MCVPLSTPRLPVASYKNSFSMTEWRIRLEGNDQSSGTPFKDTLLPLHPQRVPPVWSALGRVSSASQCLLNLTKISKL